MGNIGPMQLLIIAAVIVLLFGARKLPQLAQGLGQSLRIFRSETKGMLDDDDPPPAAETTDAPKAEPRAVEAPQAAPAEPVHNPVSESVTDQTKRDS